MVMLGLCLSSAALADIGPGRYKLSGTLGMELTDERGHDKRLCGPKARAWLIAHYDSLDIESSAKTIVNGDPWVRLLDSPGTGYLLLAHVAKAPDLPPTVHVSVSYWHHDLTAHGWLIYIELDKLGREKCVLGRKMIGDYTA